LRAVVQRVKKASVSVQEKTVGTIDTGLLVFVAAAMDDNAKDCLNLAEKILQLRIFPDENDRMNRSILDWNPETSGILLISQFTLMGDVRRGRRPSFNNAASGFQAESLYESFVSEIKKSGLTVASGIFGADMTIDCRHWGPVTILLDTCKVF